MGLDGLLRLLGDQVEAPDEETFDLFAQQFPSQNLGFIDSRAKTLELTVAGRELTIHQSPGVLSSSRPGGTTGAVVWKITPLFAEWISSSSEKRNPLLEHELLTSESSVIELGCGIAGIMALTLAPRVASYLLTDQAYVAKLVEQNISENRREPSGRTGRGSSSSSAAKGGHNANKQRTSNKQSSSKSSAGGAAAAQGASSSSSGGGGGIILFNTLDWETDEAGPELLTSATSFTSSPSYPSPSSTTTTKPFFDAIISCDSIYNEALVEPFVSTCADICRLKSRALSSDDGINDNDDSDDQTRQQDPCICIVGQQLRDPSVFETFMTRFIDSFHAWRVPDSLLPEGLRSGSGFAVHIGVLRGTVKLGGNDGDI